MDNYSLSIDVVRGTRCVLVLIRDRNEKLRQYEYEQDANLEMSARDGLLKWQNGDDNFRLEE